VCKWHLAHLSNAWITESDFDTPPTSFVDVPLHTAVAEGGIELTFKENLVRITQQALPTTPALASPDALPAAPETRCEGRADEGESISSSLRSAASTRRAHPEAEYPAGSEWIEIWFKNECRLVSGLTHWGTYSYGRWWKVAGADRTSPSLVYASGAHHPWSPIIALVGARRALCAHGRAR
jgi:hypothetical protein